MAHQRKSFFYRGVNDPRRDNTNNSNSGKHPFVKKNPLIQLNQEVLSRKIALEYLDVSKAWS